MYYKHCTWVYIFSFQFDVSSCTSNGMSNCTCIKWKFSSFCQTNFTPCLTDTSINQLAQVKNLGVILLHSLLSLTSTCILPATPICSTLVNSLLNPSISLQRHCNQPSQRDRHFFPGVMYQQVLLFPLLPVRNSSLHICSNNPPEIQITSCNFMLSTWKLFIKYLYNERINVLLIRWHRILVVQKRQIRS